MLRAARRAAKRSSRRTSRRADTRGCWCPRSSCITKAAVVDGRRDRDLATRLGGEIARARVLYEQRVPPQVRQRADYFHDELVRTLADGDATLLQLT